MVGSAGIGVASDWTSDEVMSATAGLTTKREAGAVARAETCFLSIDWRMVCILVDGVEEKDVEKYVMVTEILWRICGSQSICARFRSGRRTRLRFCGPERASVENSDCVVENIFSTTMVCGSEVVDASR